MGSKVLSSTMTQKVTVAVDLPIGLIEQERGNSGCEQSGLFLCSASQKEVRDVIALLFTPSVSFPVRLSESFICSDFFDIAATTQNDIHNEFAC